MPYYTEPPQSATATPGLFAKYPLVMITVLTLAFVVFFGAGLDHPCRIVVALIPFNFVSYCLSGCSGSGP